MSRWIQLAKSRFSSASQEPAAKTDETQVSRVLSVPPCRETEKSAPAHDKVQPVDEEAIAERAAIMEFDGGLERDQAEQMARSHSQYMVHHWHCPTCCAAGQGRGNRCTTGAPLWDSYQDAEDALSVKGSAKADRVTLMVGSRNEDRITQLSR